MDKIIAFFDIVPTVLFAWSIILLMKDLKHLGMGYSLFCAGTLMVLVSSIYKTIWKILYALEICDFAALNNSFFVMSATGFLLAGIGTLLLVGKARKTAALAVVPVYSSSMIWILFNVLGVVCMRAGLAVLAKRLNRNRAALLLWISIPVMLAMGYLSTKDFSQSIFNLIAECVNTLGQLLLLLAAFDLHKGGLENV